MEYAVDSLSSLLEALSTKDCDKVIFSGDIGLSDKLTITNNVAFDLGGYNLLVTQREGIVITKGKVSFINGTIVAPESDPIVSENAGTVVTLGADLKINATKCALYVKKKSKMIIDGADIESIGGDDAAVFVEGFGTAKDNSTLVMKSGSIVATKEIAVSIKNRGSFLLDGGNIESKVDDANLNKTSTVYVNGADTKIEIAGGKIYSEFTSALSAIEGATILLSGGEISTNSSSEAAVFVKGNKSIFTMTGGKVYSESSDGILIGGLESDQTNSLSVTGGTVAVCATSACILNVACGGACSIDVTGGRFHGKLDDMFISDGYRKELDGSGYWVVKPLDEIEDGVDGSDRYEPDDDSISTDESQSGSEKCDEEQEKTDESSFGLDNTLTIENKQGLIQKPTYVYGSPSQKFIISRIIGAVWVLSSGYNDSEGQHYSYVSYLIPGLGSRATGYVLSSLIDVKEE